LLASLSHFSLVVKDFFAGLAGAERDAQGKGVREVALTFKVHPTTLYCLSALEA